VDLCSIELPNSALNWYLLDMAGKDASRAPKKWCLSCVVMGKSLSFLIFKIVRKLPIKELINSFIVNENECQVLVGIKLSSSIQFIYFNWTFFKNAFKIKRIPNTILKHPSSKGSLPFTDEQFLLAHHMKPMLHLGLFNQCRFSGFLDKGRTSKS